MPTRAALAPKRAPLRMALACSAAAISACAGTLPSRSRNSPPMPPFSTSTAGTPNAAAAAATVRPPALVPITQISGLSSCAIRPLPRPRCLYVCIHGNDLTQELGFDSRNGRQARVQVTLTSREGSLISRAIRAPARRMAPSLDEQAANPSPGNLAQWRNSRETDLPAEQIGTQAPARLSR